MNESELGQLKRKAAELRKTAITMIYHAKSGHPGGSLSASDVIAALYFHELRIDPSKPRWDDRDRFVLSKGHVCPILYSALYMRGFFDKKHLDTLRQFGSILQGHPDMKKCPGIDISTGSLGQGFSCGVGMAIAGKRDAKPYRVFVMIGDGESQEGQIWEAAESAAKYSLDNLILCIDNNHLQNDGTCDEIMPTRSLSQKFLAFGFDIYDIDGHNMADIINTLDVIRNNRNGKPKCIVCNTIKGRYVSYMENVVDWHGMAPDETQYNQAMADLEEV